MPRGVFNWNYNDAASFLRKNGFVLNHTEGSHHFFVKRASRRMYQVVVPFHGKKAFKPKTLKGMIAQSGIEKKDWLR